ncbi:hypothetical protein BC835DRAFT_901550 [Cytidiella melzeri]|nr:hypothetical protein BC835DRAFT_901550 [Cytidiella melzeri]
MHSCLLVAEVFEIIAHFTSEDGTNPSAVASLSRTCRAFHEIAEDALWRRLNGVTALMHCFSHDICGPSHGPYAYYLNKIPQADDWHTFNRQAKRVQSLALGQSFDAEAELRALQVLELCRPDRQLAILPNLRDLRWCDLKESSFRYMSLFVHPGLANFNALIVANPRLMSQTVAYLSVAAPGLRTLKVSPGAPEHEDSRVVHALGQLLASSASLAELSVRAPVCAATLPLLAHHSQLEVLSVRLPSSLDRSVYTMATQNPTFLSLRRLTVQSENVDDVVPLLHMVKSSCFTGLLLHLKNQPTATSLHRLFTVIARHPSFQSLTILITPFSNQRSSTSPVQTSQQYVLTPSSIRRLLGLPRLSRLLLPQTPSQLDDKLLHDIASAWPCLEQLSIGTAARLDNPLALTFNSVRPSKSERNGHLTVFPDVTSLSLSSPSSTTRLSRLQLFDIGCSPVPDPTAFAQFVVEVFPCARR